MWNLEWISKDHWNSSLPWNCWWNKSLLQKMFVFFCSEKKGCHLFHGQLGIEGYISILNPKDHSCPPHPPPRHLRASDSAVAEDEAAAPSVAKAVVWSTGHLVRWWKTNHPTEVAANNGYIYIYIYVVNFPHLCSFSDVRHQVHFRMIAHLLLEASSFGDHRVAVGGVHWAIATWTRGPIRCRATSVVWFIAVITAYGSFDRSVRRLENGAQSAAAFLVWQFWPISYW